jgi:hypothetical protein
MGWAMLFFAPDFLVLMSGRIITGIGSGLCTPASYMILSEYALVRYRGMFKFVLSKVKYPTIHKSGRFLVDGEVRRRKVEA